jgi:hypothetical protein
MSRNSLPFRWATGEKFKEIKKIISKLKEGKTKYSVFVIPL